MYAHEMGATILAVESEIPMVSVSADGGNVVKVMFWIAKLVTYNEFEVGGQQDLIVGYILRSAVG